jgi:hypothetical protein
MSPATFFELIDEPAVHDGAVPAPSPWADGRALYERPPRRHVHLVEGLIPSAGLVLGTGEDKAGKSTLGVLLALSYIYGLPFLGRAIPRPGRVLIVSEEDDADELRDRMRALHQGLATAFPDVVRPPDDPASLALVADRVCWQAREGFRVDEPAHITSLLTQIQSLRALDPEGPPVLVLIDSLQAVRGVVNPLSAEGVALLKLALRQLVAADAVVYLVAHARKIVSGGKRTARASQEVAASHELAADAAATLGLMPISARADAPVRVDLVTKRGQSGVLGYLQITYTPPATWPPTSITVVLDDTPGVDTKARSSKTDRMIVDALRTLPPEPASTGHPGITRAALGTHTGLSDKTIRTALERLGALVVGELTRGAKLYRMKDAE